MNLTLDEPRFDFVKAPDKAFILAFSKAMENLGYGAGPIGSGYCWGKYMIIYSKGKKCLARIYLREASILLRLYLNQIEAHADYLTQAPWIVKSVFTEEDSATCRHCHNEKDGVCRFRKQYTLEGRLIEKCNGITFEFHDPSLLRLELYMDLIQEFLGLRSAQQTSRKIQMKKTSNLSSERSS